MTASRAELIYDRIQERLAVVMEKVPPVDPPNCCWLEEDAAESFCWEHAVIARGRTFDLGVPVVDSPWFQRDDWEDAFYSGIGASRGSEADHTEACATCGRTLAYLLTDYGAEQELHYYLESPLTTVRDEDAYALDRLVMNTWAGDERTGRLVRVAAVVNQAWRLTR